MSNFTRGDIVQHKDGRVGMVERSQPGTVTVQFPGHWRSSVVKVENVSPVEAGAK